MMWGCKHKITKHTTRQIFCACPVESWRDENYGEKTTLLHRIQFFLPPPPTILYGKQAKTLEGHLYLKVIMRSHPSLHCTGLL